MPYPRPAPAGPAPSADSPVPAPADRTSSLVTGRSAGTGAAGHRQPRRPTPGAVAPWGRRAVAASVDLVVAAAPALLLWGAVTREGIVAVMSGTHRGVLAGGTTGVEMLDRVSSSGVLDLGPTAQRGVVAAVLWWVAAWLFSRVVVRGVTGSSVGGWVCAVRLVRSADGAPPGAVRTFLREVAHVADLLSIVGWLWPTWDRRGRTFADLLCGTTVVRAG